MSFKLRFSTRAAQDIEEVLGHTLWHFGEQKLEYYKALIREAIADIGADPLAPPAKTRAELKPDARTFHLGRRGRPARHLFVYRVVGE